MKTIKRRLVIDSCGPGDYEQFVAKSIEYMQQKYNVKFVGESYDFNFSRRIKILEFEGNIE